jgi:hypothetical protein
MRGGLRLRFHDVINHIFHLGASGKWGCGSSVHCINVSAILCSLLDILTPDAGWGYVMMVAIGWAGKFLRGDAILAEDKSPCIN